MRAPASLVPVTNGMRRSASMPPDSSPPHPGEPPPPPARARWSTKSSNAAQRPAPEPATVEKEPDTQSEPTVAGRPAHQDESHPSPAAAPTQQMETNEPPEQNVPAEETAAKRTPAKRTAPRKTTARASSARRSRRPPPSGTPPSVPKPPIKARRPEDGAEQRRRLAGWKETAPGRPPSAFPAACS